MRTGKRVGLGVLVSLLAVAGLALGLRHHFGRDAESRLWPGEEIAFDALPSVAAPNVFVLCPPSRCAGAAESPVFDMPWERLRDYWREMIAIQPRVELVASDAARHRLVYVQRSAMFHFPDVVTVEFVGLGGGRSSLSIHSRSRYGYFDLGTNRARVTAWMALLQRMTRQDRRSPS